MNASSYAELVLAALGWNLYTSIWQSLFEVGILYLPFFLIAGVGWVRGYLAAGLEGAVRAVRDLEMAMLGMFTVVILAGQPVLGLSPSGMTYSKPCSSIKVTGGNTGTTYDDFFTEVQGLTGKVPVYWYGVMYLAGAFTSSAVAAIPCQPDIRVIRYRIINTRIQDMDLRRQLQRFGESCYRWSLDRFYKNPVDLKAMGYRKDDITWPGSRYFLETEGYYSHSNPNLANRAPQDLPGFPEDPVWGRKPTCKDWWLDPNVGLRKRLIDEINRQNGDDWISSATSVLNEEQDNLIRSVFHVDETRLGLPLSGSFNYSYADRHIPGLPLQIASLWDFFKSELFAYMVREAAPIVQALILMLAYAGLPFVLLFGRFSFGTVLTMTVVIFAVKFFTFWWALAVEIDNVFLRKVYSIGGALNPFSQDQTLVGAVVASIVATLLFVFVPILWLGILSWAGYRIGGAIDSVLLRKFAAFRGLSEMADAAKNIIVGKFLRR